MSASRALQPSVHLGGQGRLGRFDPSVAYRLLAEGVGLQLGADHRHVGELDKTGRPTQAQHLYEQVRQGREVALAELDDCAKVRLV